MNAKAPISPNEPRRTNGSDPLARRLDFPFDPALPRSWFAGDQVTTSLLTALSHFPKASVSSCVRCAIIKSVSPTRRCASG